MGFSDPIDYRLEIRDGKLKLADLSWPRGRRRRGKVEIETRAVRDRFRRNEGLGIYDH